jgi:hypothetical protein
MICRDIVALLAAGAPLDAEAEKHLGECAGCRSLVDSLDTSRYLIDPPPTPDTFVKLLPTMAPVNPLPQDRWLILLVMGIFLLFSLLMAALVGMKGFHSLTTGERIVYYGVVGFLGFLFSTAAVQISIPGARVRVSRGMVMIGSVVAVAVAVTILFRNFGLEHFVRQGIPCLRFGCICAALFGILAALILRKGYVTDAGSAALLIACLAGFSGVAVLSLHCPLHNAAHIIVWHLGVVAVSALAGLAIGSIFHARD